MKKRIVAFLIVFMLLPIGALAQTRQDLAAGLANVFGLKGEISGLYYYNDWQKIDKSKRAAVSQCVLSGIFEPERGEYAPFGAVGANEKKIAAQGLDKFIILSSRYEKQLGTVSGTSGNIRVTLDDGGAIDFAQSTAFLDSSGLTTCSGLSIGQKVNLCTDNANKVYIVWEQKQSGFLGGIEAYEVVGVRQGELYLWDLYEKEFIFKLPMRLRFGNWQAMSGKYDGLKVLDEARVYLGSDELSRSDINKKWLDKRANYIVGKNASDGTLKILHVEFE